MVFRRDQKEGLVRSASVMAILGLVTVGPAVSAAVLLATGFVASDHVAASITAFVFCLFGALWLAFPLTADKPGSAGKFLPGGRVGR
jgi:Family of unknown function (DUF6328)